MTDFFTFKPLPGRDYFRLVEVQAGAFAHPIRCSISERPILNAPRYEALSYAWGAQSRFGPLLELNGQSFGISTELELALRHLRRTDGVRTVWIDAMCIDQANITERNAQVTAMGDIYRGADCVVVWLGAEGDDGKRALKFLKEMARLRSKHNTWMDGIQQDEGLGSDDSDADERSSFDWNALAREPEQEFLASSLSESDYEPQEDHLLIPREDPFAETSPTSIGQRLKQLLISLKKRWTKMLWDLHWKWRNWKRILRHPLETWKDNRMERKRWQAYLNEVYAAEDPVGPVAPVLPSLYYTIGHPLAGLFSEERQSDWEALDSLFHRPWFSRAWVVQEVWSSTNCIIQCGNLKLKWKTFALAMDFHEGWDELGYMVRENKRSEIWPSLKERYDLAIHIAKRRIHDQGSSKLSDVLWSTWARDATDPRDKVFAVLGLIGDTRNTPLPKVDYSQPLRDVYKEVAAFIIGKDRKLDLLLGARGLRYSADLPSWVPDWRRSGSDERPTPFIDYAKMRDLTYHSGSTDMVLLHGHGYSASGRFEPSVSFSRDLDVLTVRGFVLDTITHVGPESEHDMETEEIIEGARETMTCFALDQTSRSPRRITVDDHELRLILRAGAPVPIENDYEYEYGGDEDKVIESMMRRRLFFVTKNGHLCIGPAQADEEDVVAIIAGCFFPMILRPRGGRYALVGEAYVHRNMASEALKKSRFFGLAKGYPDWVDFSIE